MVKFDLLLLPLVGGYLFLIMFYGTRFYHQRLDRQRLIFNSIIAAIFLSLIGLYLNNLLKIDCLKCLKSLLSWLIPIEYNGLRVSFYIFLLSIPLALLLNKTIPKNRAYHFIINKWGDEYEKLFYSSVGDEYNLLMITSKCGKVYVGYIINMSEPLKNSHITIIPSFSGYRDKETRVFKITTDYTDVLDSYFKDNKTQKLDDVVGITIPTSEIIIVTKFIPELFKGFVERENKPSE